MIKRVNEFQVLPCKRGNLKCHCFFSHRNVCDCPPPFYQLSAIFDEKNQFSSVQSLGRVQLFVTPWTAAHQASLSITNFRSLLKLVSIESVMPSNHLPSHPLSSPFPPTRRIALIHTFPLRFPLHGC